MFRIFRRNILLILFTIVASVIVILLSRATTTSVYESGSAQLERIREVPKHIATPENVRAIYMTSWVAGSSDLRRELVDFIDKSEVNSIVIDIKDYTGKIAFEIEDPVIRKMQASDNRIIDIEDFINILHSKDIYVIGRVSVFQDPHATKLHPEWAVMDSRGGVWKDRKGLSFIDPGAKEFWDYTARIARGSWDLGFDEINFDYIRYPTDGALRFTSYPHSEHLDKAVALEEFFKYIDEQFGEHDLVTSADLFGLVTWATDDLGIGQEIERAGPYFDFIAPMVYPSHYAKGFQNFENPAAHPYDVVYTAMELGGFRLESVGISRKKLRPWIQDFDLFGYEYGKQEVVAQKNAVYDAGLGSWMAWDPANRYTRDAYESN